MSIKLLAGSLINRFFLKILEINYRLLFFIPRGRISNLDIHRFGIEIKIIFDVGANIGQSIDSYYHVFNKSTIYSFEPNTQLYEIIRAKNINKKRVRPFNLALGDVKGIQVLFVPENNNEMATLNPPSFNNANNNILVPNQNVNVVTANQFMVDQNVNEIDLLKIDVEGFEIQVLKGFGKDTLSNHVKLIYIEAGYDPEDTQHTHFNIISEYLNDVGFYPSGFYDCYRWGRKSERLGFNNVLFVNTKMIN